MLLAHLRPLGVRLRELGRAPRRPAQHAQGVGDRDRGRVPASAPCSAPRARTASRSSASSRRSTSRSSGTRRSSSRSSCSSSRCRRRGSRLNQFTVAWLSVMIWGGAFNSENFRAGFEAVPHRYREAGYALGFGPLGDVPQRDPADRRPHLAAVVDQHLHLRRQEHVADVRDRLQRADDDGDQHQRSVAGDARGAHRSRPSSISRSSGASRRRFACSRRGSRSRRGGSDARLGRSLSRATSSRRGCPRPCACPRSRSSAAR